MMNIFFAIPSPQIAVTIVVLVLLYFNCTYASLSSLKNKEGDSISHDANEWRDVSFPSRSPSVHNTLKRYQYHFHHRYHGHQRGNEIVNIEHAMLEQEGLQKLVESLEMYKRGEDLKGSPFDDIYVTYRVHHDLVHNTDGMGEKEKYFIGMNALRILGKKFIVYAAGVDNKPEFENYMATELNTSVFAFDCTNQNKPEWSNFSFFPWCIGAKKDFGKNNGYSQASVNKEFEFYSLGEIKKKMNHTHIDMLKMDIEGCEWDVLISLLESKDEDLPGQLLFELHTEGANPKSVPPHIVAGRRRQKVTQLIYDLYLRNYRVMHIEVNNGDHHCAEIALVRI